MSTKFDERTVNMPAAKLPKGALLRHIPPVAFPVGVEDLWAGFNAAFGKDDITEVFKGALEEQLTGRRIFLLNSGRAAMSAALLALKRGHPSENVIIPAYTCSTVLQSVLTAGLKPVFVDVSPETLDYEIDSLYPRVKEKPLAVVGTHLFGLANDYSELSELSREAGTTLIEDAAQAYGAEVAGGMVGMQGELAVYSLGSGKCLPAGAGGILAVKLEYGARIEDILMDLGAVETPTGFGWLVKLLIYRMAVNPIGWWWVNHSRANPAAAGSDFGSLPDIQPGLLSRVQAGIGNSLLQRAESTYSLWRRNSEKLTDCLSQFPFVKLPKIAEESQPVWLRFPLVLDSVGRTDRLFDRLNKAGIGVSRSYRFTLPELYQESVANYPGAERLSNCLLTLPVNHFVDEHAVERICSIFDLEHKEQRR